MNEEIIGIEVSGEIYPIKDEKTSGKTQTLEAKVSTAERNITNLETALIEQGERLAQIETNIGETNIQELKSLVDTHEEEIKELTELIDDTITSDKKTWSSEKIEKSLEDIEKETGDVYSTEETICGKWVNNKTVYRKCIELANLVADSEIDVTDLNIDKLLKIEGFIETSSMTVTIGNYYTSGFSNCGGFYKKDNKHIKFQKDSNISDTNNGYLILEYTKTTDN